MTILNTSTVLNRRSLLLGAALAGTTGLLAAWTLRPEDLALPASQVVPHLFSFWTPIAIGISLLTVLIGDLLFRKFEGNFAQEL